MASLFTLQLHQVNKFLLIWSYFQYAFNYFKPNVKALNRRIHTLQKLCPLAAIFGEKLIYIYTSISHCSLCSLEGCNFVI